MEEIIPPGLTVQELIEKLQGIGRLDLEVFVCGRPLYGHNVEIERDNGDYLSLDS